MRILRVHDVLRDKVLVSRESARVLEGAMRDTMAGPATPADDTNTASLTVDFEGIEGIAPSFLDELISVFESITAAAAESGSRGLVVAHPPTRLSSKFEAIARGHSMSLQTLPNGSWLLQRPR